MHIKKEVLDELIKDYKRPEDRELSVSLRKCAAPYFSEK
jgi:hypothetical protein